MLAVNEVKLLADIGFMALMRGDEVNAEAIFKGVVAARPEQEAGIIGLAMVHLQRNKPEAAIALLRGRDGSSEAMAFLGLAYHRNNETARAVRVLKDALLLGEKAPGAALARDILAQIEP